MESLERFTQNQLIIEEYVSQWLAPIPSEFGRLADVATLRDVTSGHYHHPALEEVYPESAVHQALLYCHESSSRKSLECRCIFRSGICACISPEWMLRSQKLPFAGSKSNIFVPSFLWVRRHTCAICFSRTHARSSVVSARNKQQWQPPLRAARLQVFATNPSNCR
jgi:hypothetical protein